MNNEQKVLRFRPKDRVMKVGGSYRMEATVVAAFFTLSGEARYVVEADVPKGLLHIYSEHNLEAMSDTLPSVVDQALTLCQGIDRLTDTVVGKVDLRVIAEDLRKRIGG